MGRGGIYFRQTLPNNSSSPTPAGDSSSIAFTEIESGSVSQMVDSSSVALLEEINSKSKKPQIWPWILGLNLCLTARFFALDSSPGVYLLLIPLVALLPSWLFVRTNCGRQLSCFTN